METIELLQHLKQVPTQTFLLEHNVVDRMEIVKQLNPLCNLKLIVKDLSFDDVANIIFYHKNMGLHQKAIWIRDIDTLLFTMFLCGFIDGTEYKANSKKLWDTFNVFFRKDVTESESVVDIFTDELYKVVMGIFVPLIEQ